MTCRALQKLRCRQTKLKARLEKHHLPTLDWSACPVVFWDVFGQEGFPVRATISDMGPLLLSRLLQLNDTQEGVLNARIFDCRR